MLVDVSTCYGQISFVTVTSAQSGANAVPPILLQYYVALNDPYANVNELMKNNDDYLMMKNKLDPDYLDMRSDEENYINTSRATTQRSSLPHYAKIAPSANVDDVSATVGDDMKMIPRRGSASDASAQDDNQRYMNIGKGPMLQLRLPQGKRRDAPSPLLPPTGGALGDARASDDVSEICVTPPPAYNMVMSYIGSGEIEL
ncbi:hypothetical protein HPB51_001178 [Rhipicephalus microplus]|uniref:Uncharacterized protein n=1 Tax=Rhipicephalus microplus TaxID=6941 RepID=A0A9J6DRS5_RHIMP|nr:hypothetical protein HPB51_001178 [Rhipicephalus microplus]